MCTQIRFNGDWLETVGELRLRVPLIKWDKSYRSPPYHDDHCLCCVDVPATLTENGVEFQATEYGDFWVGDDV